MSAIAPVAPKRQAARRAPKRIPIEAYYKSEEKSLIKHEYHDGIVIPVAGAKLRHNRLTAKAIAIIDAFLEANGLPYIVSSGDTKVRIEAFNKIVYPDAVVICETPQYFMEREDTITNPLLIVEVMSPVTARFDRGTRFEYYRTIPSFKEYVLIHQDMRRVTVWTKQADGAWLPQDYEGEESTAVLRAIQDCPVPLARLYKGI